MRGDRIVLLSIAAAVCLAIAPRTSADGTHRLGAGAHYWRVIDDVDVGAVDESGVAWLVTYQYWPAFLGLELDLEVFPEKFAGAGETVYAPQALVLLGGVIYAGLGVGVFYADGDLADDPFYLLRAGLNLELARRLYLDVNGNYHFAEFDDIKNVDEDVGTDTVTLGAALRLAL